MQNITDPMEQNKLASVKQHPNQLLLIGLMADLSKASAMTDIQLGSNRRLRNKLIPL